MRSQRSPITALVFSIVGLAFFLARPVGVAAEKPELAKVAVSAGGGVGWLPNEFGVEELVPQFGGIFSLQFTNNWALEARGNHASAENHTSGGPGLQVTHFEGNLSLMFPIKSRIIPYVTGGAGGVTAKYDDSEAPVKLAWNAGAGFMVWFTEQVGLRVDGRDVSYKVRNSIGENKFRHSPEIFAGITVGFGGKPGDEDGDGVPNKLDQCPGTPAGVRVDANGCPIDSDGDGVPDGIDQCENTPKGAKVDARGCPSDSDKDGVFDGLDQCPDTPAGTTVDARGCPMDSDGDGVPDGIDQCANTPTGCSVDAKGCPLDDDGDGVCNGIDTCPDTPASARVDTKGCPIVVSEKETELLDTGMIRLHNVNFDTDKSTIKSESYAVLDEVGEILTRWPELKIEIGGHADWRGSDAYNLRLSQDRSSSVLAYLKEKFPALKADQYTAVGYGERVPIADNKTELGMAKNRRVEFKVLNTEDLKRVREERKIVPK